MIDAIRKASAEGRRSGTSQGEAPTANISHVSLEDGQTQDAAGFVSEEPGADECMIEVENQEALAAAVAQLSERMQLVVQLYFLEELNLAEIAAVLGVSVPRVHQIKAAALKTLRESMESTEA